MNTKYNIGDVVSVIDYYDDVFASNIISIKIHPNEKVCYELDKTDRDRNHITVSETPEDNEFYKIIKLVGTIN